MFPERFFPTPFFAGRYWAKVGATPSTPPASAAPGVALFDPADDMDVFDRLGFDLDPTDDMDIFDPFP